MHHEEPDYDEIMSIIVIIIKYIWLILVGNIILITFAYAANYPLEVVPVDRAAARYDTPENAYTSMVSALISEDIEWYFETLSVQSAEKKAALYKNYNVDPQIIFNSVKYSKRTSVIDKKNYNDGILLIVETINNDGSVLTGPSVFVLENGMWKSHQLFLSDDDPVFDYLYYIPPLFYGNGQKPDDVNSFLGYEQPKQDKTDLETGVANYPVHVYYGKTIDRVTFEADLNNQDISRLFSPKPFTDEEVEIPLQKGRNTLVLSIEGTRKDGKKATDKDRLVFVVP